MKKFFAFIIFSILFTNIISDDNCPSGMRKTYVDDTTMKAYGSAREWLAAVCFFHFPGSLFFTRKVLLEPRFEVHLKAQVDSLDIVENESEQKLYGFTIVISGNNNTISGIEKRTYPMGSTTINMADLGYNNFANSLIIEFDFEKDSDDPDDNSFSVRYCSTTCSSSDKNAIKNNNTQKCGRKTEIEKKMEIEVNIQKRLMII